jgi:hypothetical protein
MEKFKVIRWTGMFGLIGAILLFIEIPLWIIPGESPPISDASGHAQYLSDIRIIALTRILIDMLMYMSLLVFFAGFRQLIILVNKEFEWVATLNFGAGVVWWAVSLVADGLEGAAVLNTVTDSMNPVIVRTMVEGNLLIYNGAIAFAVTALFMGSAGYIILSTHALPGWIGWLGWIGCVLCFLAIPSMYANKVSTAGFYNALGWGPTIVANIPPLIWFMGAGIGMIQKSRQL